MLAPALLLTGCKTQQPALGYGPAIKQVPAPASAPDLAALGELFPWLIDEPAPVVPAEMAPGPSLVAGDWLAFECAVAGGYWEIRRDDIGPAYAGAVAVSPELE